MSDKKTLTILQLYPNDMNIYGDWGNVLILKKRAQWHGYDVNVIDYNVGDQFPSEFDIVVGGGGQDKGQMKIQADLQTIASAIKRAANSDVPMLFVCGLYQLLGRFFKTKDGDIIQGIELFATETHAGPERLIGNTIIESEQFGKIIGYENHSGQTFLDKGQKPLGNVILGAGNNGQDETEGAVFNNVIGTYLHGSLLPKNPRIADFLIEHAAINKFGSFSPTVIDDTFAKKARDVAKTRPR